MATSLTPQSGTAPVPQSGFPTYLVDGVSAAAVHNGVARIQFMRLGIDARPEIAVELAVPVSQVRSFIDAFNKVSK